MANEATMCEALEGVEFDADDKFVFMMVHNKPSGLIFTEQVSVNACCVLFLYSGKIELANFAELVLDAPGRKDLGMLALPGATGPCFATVGSCSEDLLGLPGSVIPYEVGYSCSGCMA